MVKVQKSTDSSSFPEVVYRIHLLFEEYAYLFEVLRVWQKLSIGSSTRVV